MEESYDHKKIEQKWQKYWKENETFKTSDEKNKPKFYVLDMFPYPSGVGLHVGHPKGYIASDIVSKFKRMNGFNVLHPMGWDAFGLPAENFALKNKVHPRKSTDENIKTFKKQIEIIGLDYDWSREIDTTDPNYYRWTQWIFIQLFKKGLAYESNEPINWCPSCKTGLANEDLDGNKCERCGSLVEKRPLRQWVLKIREYTDRLLEDLKDLDWPESIKESQKNWIGKSDGSEIKFKIKKSDLEIAIFTTRVDTIFGCTYVVLAPESALSTALKESATNKSEIEKYIKESQEKDEITRTSNEREKTGIKIEGLTAINPANHQEIPIFIADYVLANYGTGAVMAVPAHDERDFDFAKKYNLPIIKVVENISGEKSKECFVDDGILINSDVFSDMTSSVARQKITEKIGGKFVTNYKIRDWVFSRQRYWGEPIPIIHCQDCGAVPVPESELPVLLPDVRSYEPTGTGESPLANMKDWVNTKCPKCGKDGKRETNTMPQWAGSSWYYLRYIDAKNNEALVDTQKANYWLPVDLYIGGAEHATRHLIYARFWHKFLYYIGVVSHKEPFKKLQNVGLINGADGRKMSKRWGNVVNPNDIVKTYGADTLRLYEMFLGPFDKSVDWNTDAIIGPRRFLERIWKIKQKVIENFEDDSKIIEIEHKTIKKVTEDISTLNFNTAISELMIFTNEIEKRKNISKEMYGTLLKLLAPFAPHLTEELWSLLQKNGPIHASFWPKYDEGKIKNSSVIIGIQINGKVRGEVEVSGSEDEKEVLNRVVKMSEIQKWVEGKEVKKVIYKIGKIINIVVSE